MSGTAGAPAPGDPQAPPAGPRLWLVRHGETEWSRAHRYTGLTDLPLTGEGRREAQTAGGKLAAVRADGVHFGLVLTSPLSRARTTAELAGFPDAVVEPDAHEWDYGDYEGVRSADLRRENPGYLIWDDGVVGGERLADVAARADRIVERVRAALPGGGDALLFAHGHFNRILAARWLGLPPGSGRHFVLGTAQLCRLGWDKRTPAVELWGL